MTSSLCLRAFRVQLPCLRRRSFLRFASQTTVTRVTLISKEFCMARPPDASIRTRLREQAADYVLSHGLVDSTLRPLARALKTSARMLVYHFGSREGLMREILKC